MAMMALDAAKSVSLETRLMYSLLQIEARPPVLLVGWGITIRSNFVHVHFHNFHQYQNIFNYAPSLFCFFSPHSPVLLSLESFVPFYSLFNAPLLSSVNDKPFLAHSICLFLAEFQQVDTLRNQTKILLR